MVADSTRAEVEDFMAAAAFVVADTEAIAAATGAIAGDSEVIAAGLAEDVRTHR